MKRYFIAATLITTALLFSCKKNGTEMNAKHSWSELPSNGAIFSAYNYSEDVRSHFSDPTSGALCWDADDDIAVYSMDFSAGIPFNTIKSGVAYIDRYYAGQTSAKFKSLLSKEEWFDSDDQNATRKFFGYYPCNGMVQTIKNDYPYGEAGIIFDVKGTQSIGKDDSFSKFQILVSEPKEVSLSDETINLGAFRPITALLRFNIESEIDVDFKISQIDILLGVRPYFENGMFGSFGEEMAISGTFLLSMDLTNGGFSGINPMYLELDGRVQLLPEEAFVPGDSPEKYYYAVVCPTFEVPEDEDLYLAVMAYSEGTYTKGDDVSNESSLYKIGMLRLENGFQSGHRYDFTVKFDKTGSMKIGNLTTINLGEYDIIDWE